MGDKNTSTGVGVASSVKKFIVLSKRSNVSLFSRKLQIKVQSDTKTYINISAGNSKHVGNLAPLFTPVHNSFCDILNKKADVNNCLVSNLPRPLNKNAEDS